MQHRPSVVTVSTQVWLLTTCLPVLAQGRWEAVREGGCIENDPLTRYASGEHERAGINGSRRQEPEKELRRTWRIRIVSIQAPV